MVVQFLLARRARQCMAASSSYESVIELVLLQWLAMAAISRPCFVGSTPVEEHRPSFETLRHTSVKVVGTVLCDCCQEGRYTQNTAFLSGVSVAVDCKNRSGSENFVWQAASDRKGDFAIEIPSLGTIQKCWVHVLNNPHGSCNSREASDSATKGSAASQLLTLQSLHHDQSSIVYTVGELSYQPKAPFSFCRKGIITAFGSLNGKLQRNLHRKLKDFDAQAQKALINGAHELLHQSRRRSVLAMSKHIGRPTSYHLEPPDPPQPLYPILKKNAASAPPYQFMAPNRP
ncbi:hypothetical protein O6H91_Y003700 [Diphasiastrum complanatum]|nr:hypothetical protein O6H91_Y003700 [Diphasiastrum complanatum]